MELASLSVRFFDLTNLRDFKGSSLNFHQRSHATLEHAFNRTRRVIMSTDVPQDAATKSPPAPPSGANEDEPRYGGYTRFEIELEVRYSPSHSYSSLSSRVC